MLWFASRISLVSGGAYATGWNVFPELNILVWFPQLNHTLIIYMLGTVMAGLITVGWGRRWLAIPLLYLWLCSNNLAAFDITPVSQWCGLGLLLLSLVPSGEPLTIRKANEEWQVPSSFANAGLVLLLCSQLAWALGFVLRYGLPPGGWFAIATEPEAWNNAFTQWIQANYDADALVLFGWSFLAIQVLATGFLLAPKLRKTGWTMLLGIVLFSLVILGFGWQSLAMLGLLWGTLDGRWMPAVSKPKGESIVYFDGVCGLCNNFIDFLFEEDRHDVLQFTPIQGETAANNFPEGELQRFDSIGYAQDGKLHFKSTAALMILRDIGGIWRLLWVFRFIPRALRDVVYDIVAANRYKWFGKHETCRMPTPEERAKLLP